MAVAIYLRLDAALEQCLTDATAALHERFGGLDLLEMGLPPHVTLASYRALDLDAAVSTLQALMASSPLAVSLASAGSFGGEAGVVFLAPVVTPRTLEIHARVHAALEPHAEQSAPNYVPRAWVPHVTLAHGIAPEKLGAAIAHARTVGLPLHGRAESLEAVEYEPESGDPVTLCAQIPMAPME